MQFSTRESCVPLLALLLFGTTILAADLPDWDRPDSAIPWILADRNPSVRSGLMRSWFEALPVEHYPEAAGLLWETDGLQVSPMASWILGRWAAMDYRSAWASVEPMLEIATNDHFVDNWIERLVGPADPGMLADSGLWPRPDHLVRFLSAMETSGGLHVPEGRSISKSFRTRFEERFPGVLEDRYPGGERTEPDPGRLADARLLLTCPEEELPVLLQVDALEDNWPAVVFGLRRWARVAPMEALRGRRHGQAWEVLRTWGEHDIAGLVASWRDLEESLHDYALAALLLSGGEQEREEAFVIIREARDDDEAPFGHGSPLEPVAGADLDLALDLFRRLYPELDSYEAADLFGAILGNAFYDFESFAVRDRARALLVSGEAHPHDDCAYILMEEWGDIDVGEAARFGVDWHRRSIARAPGLSESEREFHQSWTKRHLAEVWSGKRNPLDASMDDRTYGVLRKWALCEPLEMMKWIQTVDDPELATALLWLHGHAAGGFEAGSR